MGAPRARARGGGGRRRGGRAAPRARTWALAAALAALVALAALAALAGGAAAGGAAAKKKRRGAQKLSSSYLEKAFKARCAPGPPRPPGARPRGGHPAPPPPPPPRPRLTPGSWPGLGLTAGAWLGEAGAWTATPTRSPSRRTRSVRARRSPQKTACWGAYRRLATGTFTRPTRWRRARSTLCVGASSGPV